MNHETSKGSERENKNYDGLKFKFFKNFRENPNYNRLVDKLILIEFLVLENHYFDTEFHYVCTIVQEINSALGIHVTSIWFWIMQNFQKTPFRRWKFSYRDHIPFRSIQISKYISNYHTNLIVGSNGRWLSKIPSQKRSHWRLFIDHE